MRSRFRSEGEVCWDPAHMSNVRGSANARAVGHTMARPPTCVNAAPSWGPPRISTWPFSSPTARDPPCAARQATGRSKTSNSEAAPLTGSSAITLTPLENVIRPRSEDRLSGSVIDNRARASSIAWFGRSAPSIGGTVTAWEPLPRHASSICRIEAIKARIPSTTPGRPSPGRRPAIDTCRCGCY